MNKEFVPYDIALAMKELGFDEECTAVYFGEYEERDFDNGIALEYRQSQYYAQKGWSKGLLAPLYQQAFRWFREKLKESAIEPYDMVKNYSYNMKVSWEEAQDACLKKLIEICQKSE